VPVAVLYTDSESEEDWDSEAPVVVLGERREPDARFDRREPFLCFWEPDDFLEPGPRFSDCERGPGFFSADVDFLRPGRPDGPTLPARLPAGVDALGVPGPSDEWRVGLLGVGIGNGPRLGFSLRRFTSEPVDMDDMSRMIRGLPVFGVEAIAAC
jgi:hypothetical protein